MYSVNSLLPLYVDCYYLESTSNLTRSVIYDSIYVLNIHSHCVMGAKRMFIGRRWANGDGARARFHHLHRFVALDDVHRPLAGAGGHGRHPLTSVPRRPSRWSTVTPSSTWTSASSAARVRPNVQKKPSLRWTRLEVRSWKLDVGG